MHVDMKDRRGQLMGFEQDGIDLRPRDFVGDGKRGHRMRVGDVKLIEERR